MSFCGSKISMRKIREILRLKFGDPPSSHREIALATLVSPATVADLWLRFKAAGLQWPLADNLGDVALEEKLYPSKRLGAVSDKVPPDWRFIHAERKKKNVTLALLWEEYKAPHQEKGYEYSAFCEGYRAWRGTLNLSMRQVHVYGEKCFVDFTGQTVPIVNPTTGEVTQAQVFVGVLGGSSYTYVEALPSQDLACWISAHVNMVTFFGGCPRVVVPDNLKSGVKDPEFYEPDINPTYQSWAEHYQITVLPARVRRPKDKAKAEVGVQLVQRWILAALRNRTFYSISELNEAIDGLQDRLNRKAFKKMPGSREQMFLERERSQLRPLPKQPYDLGIWSGEIKVPFDYHVTVDGRLYSVPYQLADKRVRVRLSALLVEIFHEGLRHASHRRLFGEGPAATVPDHMPSNHRAYSEWTPQRVLAWAGEIGESVNQLCQGILVRKTHPEQGFRACLGVIQLSKRYGREPLMAACSKCVRIRAFSYKSVKLMLSKNLQDRPDPDTSDAPVTTELHENIRGAAYYTN